MSNNNRKGGTTSSHIRKSIPNKTSNIFSFLSATKAIPSLPSVGGSSSSSVKQLKQSPSPSLNSSSATLKKPFLKKQKINGGKSTIFERVPTTSTPAAISTRKFFGSSSIKPIPSLAAEPEGICGKENGVAEEERIKEEVVNVVVAPRKVINAETNSLKRPASPERDTDISDKTEASDARLPEQNVEVQTTAIVTSAKEPLPDIVQPAYRKFAPLLQARTKNSLPLPPSFEKLFRLFVGLETVLNYMKSRGVTGVLHKILLSVQHQSGCSFDADLFSQIVSVYPEGYKLSPVSYMLNDEKFHSLSIEFPNDAVAEQFLSSLKRESQSVNFGQKSSDKPKEMAVQGNMLSAVRKFTEQTSIRRLEFQKRMEALVAIEHNKFLKDGNITFEMDPILPKWHPNFNLATVPDVEKSVLPIKKAVPFLEALRRRSGMFTTPDKKIKVESHISTINVAESKPPSSEIIAAAVATPKTPPPTPAVVAVTEAVKAKPLSRAQALLERVREKNKLKEEAEKAKPKESADVALRRGMLVRIRPIASSLLNHANLNGKKVLSVSEAIAHLQLSFPEFFFSAEQFYDHIKFLAELVPAFCTLEVAVAFGNLPKLLPHHYLIRFGNEVRMNLVAINDLTRLL